MIPTREREQSRASAPSPQIPVHADRAAVPVPPRVAAAPPRLAGPADVLAMQRVVGNRAVSGLLGARAAPAPAANGVVQRTGKHARDEEDESNPAWKGKGPAEEEEESLLDNEGPSKRARYARRAKPEPDFRYGPDGGKHGWKPARRKSIEYGDFPLALAIRAVGMDPGYTGLLAAYRRAGMSDKLTERIWAFFHKHRPAHFAAVLRTPGALLSRNHRLADSVIGMLVTVAHYNLTLPANAPRHDEMMEAFEAFARAVAGDEAGPAVEYFRAAIELRLADKANRPEILRLLGRVSEVLSMSATNVRPGWSELNRMILSNFDPNVGRDGRMTPISEGIERAVHGLAAAGVVTAQLASQAVRRAVVRGTGETLSSTVRPDEDSDGAGPAPPLSGDAMEGVQELVAAAAAFEPASDPSDDDMYDEGD